MLWHFDDAATPLVSLHADVDSFVVDENWSLMLLGLETVTVMLMTDGVKK